MKKYKCASSLPLRLYTRYKGLWSPRYSRDAAQFLLSKWYRLYAKVNPSPPRVADDGTAFSRAAPPARPEEAPSRMSPLPGRGLRLGFVGLALQSASATQQRRGSCPLCLHEQPTDGSDRGPMQPFSGLSEGPEFGLQQPVQAHEAAERGVESGTSWRCRCTWILAYGGSTAC